MPADKPDWAAWQHDEAAAAYWAPRIARALNAGMTAREAEHLAGGYAASNPGPRDKRTDAELAAAALLYLEAHLPPNTDPLTQVLTSVRTDGFLLGAASSHAVIDKAPAGLATYVPGHVTATRRQIAELDGSTGLPYALADAGERAEAITETHRRRLARLLALAALAGDSPYATAAAMLALADSSSHLIALSELVAAIGIAALFVFGRRQVRTWRWITDPRRSNVCPRCQTNEDQGPIPVGQPFSSGDTSVPAHPKCACGIDTD